MEVAVAKEARQEIIGERRMPMNGEDRMGVTRAEKIRPGYRRNPTNMAALRKWMAIQDSDKPELSRQTIDAQKKVSSQIETLGAPSWCASILGLFGPEGTLARGLPEAQ
jgi:hypothetical protein